MNQDPILAITSVDFNRNIESTKKSLFYNTMHKTLVLLDTNSQPIY